VGAWVWFVISAVTAVAGVTLLLMDRGQRTAQSRERRRWAALRGWQFAGEDPVLPDRWRHGVLARGGTGVARHLVSGSLFTAAGRRMVHVFDYEQGGRVEAVVATVHRRVPQDVVLELWLPTVEFPTDAGLDLLGPVGERYAFTSDLAKARPLITPELVALADDAGDDVTVMWIEDAWVAAAAAPGTLPSRLERLLRLLGDLADLVDGVHESTVDSPGTADTDADTTEAYAGTAEAGPLEAEIVDADVEDSSRGAAADTDVVDADVVGVASDTDATDRTDAAGREADAEREERAGGTERAGQASYWGRHAEPGDHRHDR
jgi:hypothetical protein